MDNLAGLTHKEAMLKEKIERLSGETASHFKAPLARAKLQLKEVQTAIGKTTASAVAPGPERSHKRANRE